MILTTARAMQIVLLTDDQLHKIQALERRRGYLIANWNIQSLLNLPTIKVSHHIPDDGDAQRKHSERIENDIRSAGLLKTESADLSFSDPDRCHSFDWGVRKSGIMWTYAGGGRGRNLKGQAQEQNNYDNEHSLKNNLENEPWKKW